MATRIILIPILNINDLENSTNFRHSDYNTVFIADSALPRGSFTDLSTGVVDIRILPLRPTTSSRTARTRV